MSIVKQGGRVIADSLPAELLETVLASLPNGVYEVEDNGKRVETVAIRRGRIVRKW